MTPDEWFAQLTAALAQATESSESVNATAATDPTDPETALLLELARVAAHSSARWTAPVTTYRLGLALAAVPVTHRRDVLAQIVDALAPLAETAP